MFVGTAKQGAKDVINVCRWLGRVLNLLWCLNNCKQTLLRPFREHVCVIVQSIHPYDTLGVILHDKYATDYVLVCA